MTWIKKNNYYMQNDTYTITKSHSPSSILPYGLFEGNRLIGHFKTLEMTQAKHREVTK